MQRDTKEVLAELVGKVKEKLDRKKVAATSVGEEQEPDVKPSAFPLRNTESVLAANQRTPKDNIIRFNRKTAASPVMRVF
jgi:hypothetical protein